MFNPEEIIFAPSLRCNLKCPHCFLSGDGTPDAGSILDAVEACSFLKSCLESGRDDLSVGFSGGEPFLSLDFLCRVSEFAFESGFVFSRVITNGVFSNSKEEIKSALLRLRDSGFDGKIAMSFDGFHGQKAEEAAFFLRTVLDVFCDSSSAEIWSVMPSPGDSLEFYPEFLKTAEILEAEITPCPRGSRDFFKPGRVVLRGPDFFIPVYKNRRSFGSWNLKWNGENWFTDDFCEGPGQCIYIHPDGSVAPCCGFANYRDALKIGSISDGYKALIETAAKSPAVSVCYGKGLGTWRAELESQGFRFPGKTGDICAFCDYLCTIENGFSGLHR